MSKRDITIEIHGQVGSGKSLLAQEIHHHLADIGCQYVDIQDDGAMKENSRHRRMLDDAIAGRGGLEPMKVTIKTSQEPRSPKVEDPFLDLCRIPEINGCARCDGNHLSLRFNPLSNHPKYNAWAMCPTNNMPILIKVESEWAPVEDTSKPA